MLSPDFVVTSGCDVPIGIFEAFAVAGGGSLSLPFFGTLTQPVPGKTEAWMDTVGIVGLLPPYDLSAPSYRCSPGFGDALACSLVCPLLVPVNFRYRFSA